jgi:hypothetical protein
MGFRRLVQPIEPGDVIALTMMPDGELCPTRRWNGPMRVSLSETAAQIGYLRSNTE